MNGDTITELPVANSIDPVQDVLPIVTNNSNTTQQINRNTFLNLASQPVGLTDSQTVTNKTLSAPTISSPVFSGTLTGTYTIGGSPTFPSSIATLTGTQTLTNKTLTSPAINSPTITNASITADSITGYTTSNAGTIYGISVSGGNISGSIITSSTIPYTALTTDSTWAWSTFTPSPTGYTGTVTVTQATYKQIGKTVVVSISFTGTSNATTCTFTLPVAPKNAPVFQTTVTDSGTVQTSPGFITTSAASTTATCYKTLASGAFTSSGTKTVQSFGMTYEVS